MVNTAPIAEAPVRTIYSRDFIGDLARDLTLDAARTLLATVAAG
jgi:hypothetical protein